MKKLTSNIQQNNDFTFIDLLRQNKKLEMYGNKFELIKNNGKDWLTVNGEATPFMIGKREPHILTDFDFVDESTKVFIDGREFKVENDLRIDKDGSIAFLLVLAENIEGTFFGFNKETLDAIRVEDNIFYKTKDNKIIEANHYPKYLLDFNWKKLSALNEKLKQNNQDVSDNVSEQFSRFKKIRNTLVGYDVPDDDKNPAFVIDIQCWKIGKDKMLFVEPYFSRCYDSEEEDEKELDKLRFVLWDEKYKQVNFVCETNCGSNIMADEKYIYLQSYDNNKLKTDIYSLVTFKKVKTIEKNVNNENQTLHINRETLSYYDENDMNKMIKAFVLEQQQKVQAVNKIQRVFRKYKRDKQQNNNNINLNLENKKDQKKDDCCIC